METVFLFSPEFDTKSAGGRHVRKHCRNKSRDSVLEVQAEKRLTFSSDEGGEEGKNKTRCSSKWLEDKMRGSCSENVLACRSGPLLVR